MLFPRYKKVIHTSKWFSENTYTICEAGEVTLVHLSSTYVAHTSVRMFVRLCGMKRPKAWPCTSTAICKSAGKSCTLDVQNRDIYVTYSLAWPSLPLYRVGKPPLNIKGKRPGHASHLCTVRIKCLIWCIWLWMVNIAFQLTACQIHIRVKFVCIVAVYFCQFAFSHGLPTKPGWWW